MLTFFSPIVFAYILSLWTILPLGSDTLDSVRDVTLVACVPGYSHVGWMLPQSLPHPYRSTFHRLEMANLGSISTITSSLTRFLRDYLVSGFYMTPKCHPFQSSV